LAFEFWIWANVCGRRRGGSRRYVEDVTCRELDWWARVCELEGEDRARAEQAARCIRACV